MSKQKLLAEEELVKTTGGNFKYMYVVLHIKYSCEENNVYKEKTDDLIQGYRPGLTTAEIGRIAKNYCAEKGYTFINVTHTLR